MNTRDDQRMFELLTWAAREVCAMPEAAREVKPEDEEEHCHMLATLIFDKALTRWKKEKTIAEACGIES
jgi:hypothetical protein